ncbi:hypothetical protein BC629DRAFT_1296992 [Irpex lacteus]|nr:hypothetical protein BC629DRAFT_1296992 [Irpex lacteus]
MADSKGPTMTANRLAMSKALGAAFLSHQVEQLEQKVVGSGRGGGGGNWREGRRGQGFQGRGTGEREWGRRGGGGGVKGQGRRNGSGSEAEYSTQRRWRDESRGEREREEKEKDADVVVVDVSVLVHGISHLKKWCREGRQEVVIIPLEALNTLDLLKKGTTSLAQRARAASRILEAQVGTNPRIRVQRDDAFVLWDSIPFSTTFDNNSTTTNQVQPPASPEWVRRTICCARWEIEHATPPTTDIATATTDSANKATPKVVLAVCTSDIDSTTSKDTTPAISASPVPLPAPQPNKFEPRSAGTLVCQWAIRAGIKVLAVPPTIQSQGSGGGGGGGGGHYQQSKPLVERPPAVMAMMEAVSQPSRVVRVLARGEKLDAN